MSWVFNIQLWDIPELSQFSVVLYGNGSRNLELDLEWEWLELD